MSKRNSTLGAIADVATISAASDLREIRSQLAEAKKRDEHAEWRRIKDKDDQKVAEMKAEADVRYAASLVAERDQDARAGQRAIWNAEYDEEMKQERLKTIEIIRTRNLRIRADDFPRIENWALERERTLEEVCEQYRTDLIQRELGGLLPDDVCPPEQLEGSILRKYPEIEVLRAHYITSRKPEPKILARYFRHHLLKNANHSDLTLRAYIEREMLKL